MPVSTESTAKKQAKFLAALCEGLSVTGAAKAARVERTTPYLWRKENADFAAAWEEAVEAGGDALEDEAMRRGAKGTLKPVFQGGRRVGTVREYSDTLLIFLLKGRRPHKYRERFDINLSDKSDAELLAIIAASGDGGTGAPPHSDGENDGSEKGEGE